MFNPGNSPCIHTAVGGSPHSRRYTQALYAALSLQRTASAAPKLKIAAYCRRHLGIPPPAIGSQQQQQQQQLIIRCSALTCTWNILLCHSALQQIDLQSVGTAICRVEHCIITILCSGKLYNLFSILLQSNVPQYTT